MGSVLAVLSAWILAQAAAPAPVEPAQPASSGSEAPAPTLAAPPAPEPPEEEAPPPVPLPSPEPHTYGYAGMSEISLALGYSSVSGFVGGGGFRHFVVTGVAPGLEGRVQTGKGATVGFLLGSL